MKKRSCEHTARWRLPTSQGKNLPADTLILNLQPLELWELLSVVGTATQSVVLQTNAYHRWSKWAAQHASRTPLCFVYTLLNNMRPLATCLMSQQCQTTFDILKHLMPYFCANLTVDWYQTLCGLTAVYRPHFNQYWFIVFLWFFKNTIFSLGIELKIKARILNTFEIRNML